MKKQMYESLKQIQKKYQNLIEKLNSSSVIQDIEKYNKFNKEANDLEDIAKAFDKYDKLQMSIQNTKKLLEIEKNEELIHLAKLEIEENEAESKILLEKIKILLVPKDPRDGKNVVVEIRGAAGGDEANIFGRDLFDIYKKWSSLNKMKIQIVETSKSESGGFSLVVFKVIGPKAYSKLKFETGVHRVQRVPITETQGRVHTSTVTVTVMPEIDDKTKVNIQPSDLKIDTFRSSGAGGQSVNTTDSAVRMTHKPTGLVVSSQNQRSQLQNRETCLNLLRVKIYDLKIQQQQKESASFRALAGSGARSEKVRTYNYPQDRVTDHRINFSVSLKEVLDGKINSIIQTLQAAAQAIALENSEAIFNK